MYLNYVFNKVISTLLNTPMPIVFDITRINNGI